MIPRDHHLNEMSTEKTVRKEFGEVEENALRLDQEKADQIVEALNDDLADAYVLYHQLRKHHWNVEGAEFRDIHIFLGEAAENVEAAADEIAERLQAIGGAPVSSMPNLSERAGVSPEDGDVYPIRTSLKNDLEMYGEVIESLREHVELATELGDHATAEVLRQILVETEDDAHHLDHYLEDDTLVFETSAE
jgi:starvation-inducible DNA-binding protein